MRQFLTRTLLLLALLSSAPSRRVVVGTPYELVSILHFMRKIKDTNCQSYYPRSILTHLTKSTQRCRNYWGIREYPTHWRIIDIYKQPCTIYHTWKKASRSGVYREKIISTDRVNILFHFANQQIIKCHRTVRFTIYSTVVKHCNLILSAISCFLNAPTAHDLVLQISMNWLLRWTVSIAFFFSICGRFSDYWFPHTIVLHTQHGALSGEFHRETIAIVSENSNAKGNFPLVRHSQT